MAHRCVEQARIRLEWQEDDTREATIQLVERVRRTHGTINVERMIRIDPKLDNMDNHNVPVSARGNLELLPPHHVAYLRNMQHVKEDEKISSMLVPLLVVVEVVLIMPDHLHRR